MGERKKAALCALTAGSLWGTIGLFVKLLSGYGFSSIQLTVIRFVVSSVLVTLFLCWKDPKAFVIAPKDIIWFLITGVCCMLFFNVCYAVTISKSSMATAAVLLYTSPALVSVLSIPVFKEKPSKRRFLSVLLAVTGCAFVSGIISGQMRISTETVLWGLFAALGYAMYSITAGKLLKRYSSVTVLYYSLLTAALAGICIGEPIKAVAVIAKNPETLILFAVFSLLCNILSYFCYNRALEKMEASSVSILASVEPVVAAVLGFLIFKEPITPAGVIGICCVVAAVLILNGPEREKAKE